MGLIDDTLTASLQFTTAQVQRLNSQILFIGSFSNVTDTIKQNLVNQIMNVGFLSATTPLTGLSDLLADTNLITSPLSAVDFIAQQTELVASAIDKVVDPSLPTGISDVLADNAQSFVQDLIPNSSDAAFQAIQNRVLGVSEASAQQQLAGTLARNLTIPFGANSVVEEVERDVYDGTKKAFNKAFSLAGLTISADPSAIFGIIGNSITLLLSAIDTEDTKLDEIDSLVADLNVLAADFTPAFYNTDDVANIRSSRDLLSDADDTLINVRSRMLTQGIFSSTLFGSAKSKVEEAEQALDQGLTVTPKLSEIISKVDRMDLLLDEIASEHSAVIDVKTNVESSVSFWQQERVFGAIFAGQIQNVQTEIRSIIESMGTAIDSPRRGITIPLLSVWRAQLLLILQTMCALPDEIDAYFSQDPDGLKADLDTTISNFSSITDVNVDLLVSQGQAYTGSIRRASAVPVDLNTIISLGVAVTTETGITKTFLADLNLEATNHVQPGQDVLDTSSNIRLLFETLGMDRTVSVIDKGDFATFFTLDSKTATFTGQLLSNLDRLILCLLGESGAFQLGLDALQLIQEQIFNVKRAEELLTVTFGQFRDSAIDSIIGFDLPFIQKISATIQVIVSGLTDGPCDII